MDQVLVDGLTVNADKSHFSAIVSGIQRYQQELSTNPASRVNSDAHFPPPLRMLSFDGAAYAPLTLRLLAKLEAKYPGFLEQASAFCGTSDGALISLALSFHLQRGASGAEAIRKAIDFEDKVIAAFSPTLRDWARFVSGQGPLYGAAFADLLKETFGEHTPLSYLADRPVSLVAFNATEQRPFTFTCFGPQASNLTIVQAALAVSSFPFMMPMSRAPEPTNKSWYQPRAGDILLDGGLGNNDPTLAGLSDALLCLCDGQEDFYWTARRFLPYLRVLSFGARPPAWERQKAGSKQLEWGWLKLLWEVGPGKILDLLVGGPSASNQGICKQLLGVHRFQRFESPLSLTGSLTQVMFSAHSVRRVVAEYDQLANKAWNDELAKASEESPYSEFPVLPNWVERFWMPDWAREHARHW